MNYFLTKSSILTRQDNKKTYLAPLLCLMRIHAVLLPNSRVTSSKLLKLIDDFF